MLKFGKSTTKLLEEAYQGADIRRRRRASFDALVPCPGDRLLDLGCGNGLLTEELSRAVGENGAVTGLDPSDDMLAAARERLAGRKNVQLVAGKAEALPFPDGSFDGAVSLQVFEYFDDVTSPLRELHRVLRPGGRVVISDMHFGTLVWRSDNPDRMRRVLALYDEHLARRALPEELGENLSQTGFERVTLTPVVFLDTQLSPDGLARMMLELVPMFCLPTGKIGKETLDGWREEQITLARKGRFFFSINHYVCHATRS